MTNTISTAQRLCTACDQPCTFDGYTWVCSDGWGTICDDRIGHVVDVVTLDRYRTTYVWPEGSDQPVTVGVEHDTFTYAPSEYADLVDALAHDMADCVEASCSNWFPRVWYSAEVYSDPYGPEFYETTYHADGLCPVDSKALYSRITGQEA